MTFDTSGTAAPVDDAVAVDDEPPRRLLCARCGAPITRTDARISIAGQHVYERVNPGGFVYRFGCFSSAEGCRSQGVPSKQATWFAGYWWQAQGCAGCDTHLGWLFFSATHQFHGLVLDCLVEERPGS